MIKRKPQRNTYRKLLHNIYLKAYYNCSKICSLHITRVVIPYPLGLLQDKKSWSWSITVKSVSLSLIMYGPWLCSCCVLFSYAYINPEKNKEIKKIFKRCFKCTFVKRYVLFILKSASSFPIVLFLVTGWSSVSWLLACIFTRNKLMYSSPTVLVPQVLLNKKLSQLSQRDRAMLHITQYFALLLEITQGHSKWHPWVWRVEVSIKVIENGIIRKLATVSYSHSILVFLQLTVWNISSRTP